MYTFKKYSKKKIFKFTDEKVVAEPSAIADKLSVGAVRKGYCRKATSTEDYFVANSSLSDQNKRGKLI